MIKTYRKKGIIKTYPYEKGIIEASPYEKGMILEGVSVSDVDDPNDGGWIARDPNNHDDQWFINNKYFSANYEEHNK